MKPQGRGRRSMVSMSWSSAPRSSALGTVIAAAMVALIAGCSASPESRPTTAETSQTGVGASPTARVGGFPEFPHGLLPEPMAAALQAVLDSAVEEHVFRGATAAVIVVDKGSWSGAVGVDRDGKRLTRHSSLLTASSGKTITAAQILRLVDDGELGLDDPISDHLPETAFFDPNDATIRDLLGMRSGISEPPGYVALVDQGFTPAELFKKLGRPTFPAGSEIEYSSINFIMLGRIIEHVTGRTFSEVVRSNVLDRPGLDGLVYGEKSALAADGWRIETTAASLARWGYELYGGSVVSDDSLRQMTDFKGDWYGLGTIDFSHPDTVGGYDVPAVGHGGSEPSNQVMLVAFPEHGVVVAVQANAYALDAIGPVAAALRDATQP
jgi:D-alanyl-D-alanine carboxypeptidase